MSELMTRIDADLRVAMKERDAARRSTLRLIVAALKDREIAMRADDGVDALDDVAVAQILSKMVRQREETVRIYEEGGRLELAESERAEIEVIAAYLPRQFTVAEIEAAVAAAVAETGAAGIKDMGRVMAALKAAHAGRMDFGKAGAAVKAALS